MHRPYTHAQDIDALSIPKRSLGDGHDIHVVTILQGVGYEDLERFAGGGKAMIESAVAIHQNHFADAGNMVSRRNAEGLFSPILLMTAPGGAVRSDCCY